MDILEGLNNRQKEAVTAVDGKIKVVAGAGSGKTKALTHRYAYLVEEVGILPANILCLTFTNKAAQEMRKRISAMVHTGHFSDFVSTIHGFCVKVLRRDIYRIGYPSSFTILDEEDMKLLAKEVINESDLKRTDVTVAQFLTNVSKTKNEAPFYVDELLVPKSLRLNEYPEPNENDTFRMFVKKQQKAFAIDFNDIIFIAIYLLQRYNDVKEYWQDQFEYIMVDETQDCNGKDWQLVNIISEKKNNVFVVGDPDQAIYEWRGAKPQYFVGFEADKTIILDENYRSTQNILDVANCVISHNQDRIEKNLFTRKESKSNIIHFHAKSEQEEGEWVAKKILEIQKSGSSLTDIAILYRAAYLSRSVEQELMKKHIQYVIYGGVRFFERKEIKDALSYLRLITSEDNLSFLRILNTPSRKLGDAFKKKLAEVAEKEGVTLYQALKNHIDEKPFNKESAKDFVSIIEEAKQQADFLAISDLCKTVLLSSGYEEMLRLDDDKERIDNLQELIQSIIDYENINAENEINLNTYLQDISLYTNMDYKDAPEGVVKLMTIHQAKGLEFPYVFVIGLTEGILPNHHSIRVGMKQALEEERRLMYVAITRAEKELYFTESEGYNFSTQSAKYPSRFISEIKKKYFVTEGKMDESLWVGSKELAEQLDRELSLQNEEADKFKMGDKVIHKIFGEGEVLLYDKRTDACSVKFKNGEKKILAKALTLKI